MKQFVKLLAVVAVVMAVCSVAAAQGSEEQAKKDLMAIEKEIGRANFECDYKYFAQVEATEFFFIGPNGNTETRDVDLAGEKDCHKFNGTYDLDETRINVYKDTAVYTARVTISGKNKEGKDFTHRSRFTDVFVWRDGRWQLVAGHSSKIPDAK